MKFLILFLFSSFCFADPVPEICYYNGHSTAKKFLKSQEKCPSPLPLQLKLSRGKKKVQKPKKVLKK